MRDRRHRTAREMEPRTNAPPIVRAWGEAKTDGSKECDFKLTAALAQSSATGTAEVVSCPAQPSLVGTTITVQNIPESGGNYVFFGAINAQGRATENPQQQTWWIENMECIPEEPPLQLALVTGTTGTAETGTWRVAAGATGSW